MAGSYNHVVDDKGQLLDNELFVNMIENLGDAYEAVEEMYGMIWWLAFMKDTDSLSPEKTVENARQNYKNGLVLARAQL